MIRKLIIDIAALLFVLLFVYAAFTKLLDFEKFVVQLGQSPMLTAYATWVAFLVPIVEIAIAIVLSIQRFRLAGFYCAFTLMIMFTAYIVAILNFSTYIPCSCGGVLEKLGWTEHLLFNIAFVILAVTAIVLETKERMGHFEIAKSNALKI